MKKLTKIFAFISVILGFSTPISPLRAEIIPQSTVSNLRFKDFWFSFKDAKGNFYCKTDARMYIPTTNSKLAPNPAVIVEHGFGESKEASYGMAEYLAKQNYVTIAYSALGFGKSSCQISMDDPQVDGLAAKQVVDYLAGRKGIAFNDAELKVPNSTPVYIKNKLSNGKSIPVVGMVGQSYGGGVQFAAAAVDPRISAIVPLNTFDDWRYSLAPDFSVLPGEYKPSYQGVSKRLLAGLLGVQGISYPFVKHNMGKLSTKDVPCPNMVPALCNAFVQAGILNSPNQEALDFLYKHSVGSFADQIHTPTLLIQSEKDMLFDLKESIATFQKLSKHNSQVSLLWQENGHGYNEDSPGNLYYLKPDKQSQYVIKRIVDWFDYYLHPDTPGKSPAAKVEIFRDWVKFKDRADKAYLKFNDLSILNNYRRFYPKVDSNTSLSIPVNKPLTLIGTPVVYLNKRNVTANPKLLNSTDNVTTFLSLYDVDAQGRKTRIGNESALSVGNATKKFYLAPIVHKFEKGHKLVLELNGTSIIYSGFGLTKFDTAFNVPFVSFPVYKG